MKRMGAAEIPPAIQRVSELAPPSTSELQGLYPGTCDGPLRALENTGPEGHR